MTTIHAQEVARVFPFLDVLIILHCVVWIISLIMSKLGSV